MWSVACVWEVVGPGGGLATIKARVARRIVGNFRKFAPMRHFRIKQACIPAAEVLTSRPGRKANNSARVAELVDALDSGSSGGNPVKVRVLSRAPCLFSRGYEIEALAC